MTDGTTNYTMPQRKLFRAVAGAVRNTGHGHPNWNLTRTMERSIAKRAIGTLSALWPGALAAATPSDSRALSPSGGDGKQPSSGNGGCEPPAHGGRVPVRRAEAARERRRASGPCARAMERRSLKLLHNKLGFMAGEAKRAEQWERAEGLIEALRVIAAELRDMRTNHRGTHAANLTDRQASPGR